MKEIIDFFSKTNHKKSAISIVIMIFVVGLFSSVNNLGSTYAAENKCYFCTGVPSYSTDNTKTCNGGTWVETYPSRCNTTDGGSTGTISTYTVTYNANGGSGAPTSQTKTHDVNLTLRSGTPSRAGYDFLGWGLTSNATSVSYLPGSVYSKNANLNLYAIWVTDGDATEKYYTVTYNANGGSGAPSPDKKVDGVTLYLSKTLPKRAGYKFLGWGMYSADEIVDFLPGGPFNVNANTTLFAIWEEDNSSGENPPSVNTYWVSFNPNGGTWSDGSTYVKVKDNLTGTNSFDSLKVSSSYISKSGYTFGGWKNPSTGQVYTQNVDSSDNGLELLAVWNSGSSGSDTPSTPTSYTVSYNANGGSGAPASQTKTHGTNLTLSSTEPTRTGYKFLGWATSNTATSAKYSAGGTYSDNASTTLYAVWKPYCVTITFYAGGGSVTSKTSAGTWTVTNDLIALNGDSQLSQLCNGRDFTGTSLVDYNNSSWLYITKSGYSVPEGSEWKCKSGCTTSGKVFDQAKTNQPSDFCDNSKKDCSVQLIVNWKANTYSVKFDANGGSGAPATQTKTHGTNLTLSSTVPTKAGYKFLGWTTSSTSTTVKYNAGSTYSDNKAVTLYAVWAPYKLSIYYYANGGIVTSKTSGGTWTVKNDLIFKDAAEYVTSGFYGKTLSSDGLVNYNNDEYLEITKIGYSAVSGAEWKCKSGCATSGKTFDQVTAYKVSDFCDISKSDCKVELAVNWAPTTYKISYDLNGGMISGNPSSAKFDEVVTINNPSKTVSIVADENGTGAIIGESASVISKFLGWTSTSIDTNTAYHGSTAWKDGSTKVVDISFKNLASVKDKTVKLVANWESTSLVLPTISKNGYNCSWNTKNTGKGTSYNSGATYSVVNDTDSSIKLYAICKLPGSNISSDGSSNTNTDSGIKNPQTGRPLMIATISIALFALGYVIYGVKKGKISF